MNKLGFYVSIIMAVGGAFGAGWTFRETFAPIKEEVVTETVVISVLEEEQKCKEAGGEFEARIPTEWSDWVPAEERHKYELVCFVKRPNEILFNHKIK